MIWACQAPFEAAEDADFPKFTLILWVLQGAWPELMQPIT